MNQTNQNLFLYIVRKLYWNVHSYSWDEYLDNTGYAEEIEKIVQIVMSQKSGDNISLLDIGCATGNYSIAFSQKCFFVTGIDYAKKMIKRAQKKADTQVIKNIEFQLADFNSGLNFAGNQFDIVIASHIFQGAKDNSFVSKEIERVLSNQGLLFLIAKKQGFRVSSKMKKNRTFTGTILNMIKPVIFAGYKKRNFDIMELQNDIISAGFTLCFQSETLNNHVIGFKKAKVQ